MDALSEALRSVRASGALFFNAEFSAPWGFASPRSSTFAPILSPGSDHLVLFHLVTEGRATVRVDGCPDLQLEPGDVVILPHGDAHEVYRGRFTQHFDSSRVLSNALAGSLELERGGGGGALTKFVCGYIGCERYAERLFLAGLPAVFKVALRADPSGAWIESSILHGIAALESGRPGRVALLSKLAEALFVEMLCIYMDKLPRGGTGWLAAARDVHVGRALAQMHREPSRAWTLAALAKEAGVSRTVLAERFTRLLGEPPITYLARWRLQLAARLLETTDDGVLQIALAVGYESEAAFNRAFKREFDLPPARYRRSRARTEVTSGRAKP
jgi:AraC-like DNA-binding protein